MSFSRPLGVSITSFGHVGDRNHMEDENLIFYNSPGSNNDKEFIFAAVFDGHGGKEAAQYAKKHLMSNITQHDLFYSKDDTHVLEAVKLGFNKTHSDMWNVCENWPRTVSGNPGPGTTATIVFIMQNKLYIGHVGDSLLIVGRSKGKVPNWTAKKVTETHSLDNHNERVRIRQNQGDVFIDKKGHKRVRILHKPEKTATCVTRSLGDLWSYNLGMKSYVISPEPFTKVMPITDDIRCLILASDGVLSLSAIDMVRIVENEHVSQSVKEHFQKKYTSNPSQVLTEAAMTTRRQKGKSADNTTVLTIQFQHSDVNLFPNLDLEGPINWTIGGPKAYDFTNCNSHQAKKQKLE